MTSMTAGRQTKMDHGVHPSASGQLSQIKMTSTANLDTPASFEQSRRQISSIILSEEIIGSKPEENKVTYVEVPVVKEVIKYVPKVSVVEVEKYVPKYQIEHIEEVVEVPEVKVVERAIEKIVQHEPGTKLIEEVTREVIKHVPKIEYRQTEKIVQIPGETIEVPVIKRDVDATGDDGFAPDKEVAVVVAQTIRPVLTQVFDKSEKVDVYQYNPKAVPVSVLVAKPVPSQLVAVGAVSEDHHRVTVPAPHFNTILKTMNQHLSEEELVSLPYQLDPDCNRVTFLHPVHTPGIVDNPDLILNSGAPSQYEGEEYELMHQPYDPNMDPQAMQGMNTYETSYAPESQFKQPPLTNRSISQMSAQHGQGRYTARGNMTHGQSGMDTNVITNVQVSTMSQQVDQGYARSVSHTNRDQYEPTARQTTVASHLEHPQTMRQVTKDSYYDTSLAEATRQTTEFVETTGEATPLSFISRAKGGVGFTKKLGCAC